MDDHDPLVDQALVDIEQELGQPIFDPKLEPTRYLTGPIRLSPTRSELSGRCFRRHLLSDILRRLSFKSPSAIYGGILHKGAASWWTVNYLEEGDRTRAVAETLACLDDPAWANIGPRADGSPDKHTKDQMRTTLEAYMASAKVAGDLPGEWRLVSVETRGWFPVSESRMMPYQMDRLLEKVDEPETRAVIDTKSSYRIDQDWRNSMSRSIQQRLYHWANGVHLGHPIAHLFVEGISKWTKDRTPVYHWASLGWDRSYIMEAVDFWNRCVDRLEDFQADVDEYGPFPSADEHYLAALAVAVAHPEFNYQDCHSYHFPCPYLTLCDTSVGDRLGLALSDFYLGEPWDTEDQED